MTAAPEQPRQSELGGCGADFVGRRREAGRERDVAVELVALKPRDQPTGIAVGEIAVRGDSTADEPTAEGSERHSPAPSSRMTGNTSVRQRKALPTARLVPVVVAGVCLLAIAAFALMV